MALSKIDLEDAGLLRAEILSNRNRSFAEISAFIGCAQAMLAQFEEKLARLEQEKERAYRALCQCELHKNDDEEDKKSCDAEESEYQRAAARYNRCLSLVNQARKAINDFKASAARNREVITQLVTRSERAMTEINNILQQYLSNDIAIAAGGGAVGPMGGRSGGNRPGGSSGGNGQGDGQGHGGSSGGGQRGPSGDGQGVDGQGGPGVDGQGPGGNGQGPGGDGHGGHSGDGQGHGGSCGDGQGDAGGGDKGNLGTDSNNGNGELGLFGSGNGSGEASLDPSSHDFTIANEGASGATVAAGVGAAALAAGAAVGAAGLYANKDKEGTDNFEEKDGKLYFRSLNVDENGESIYSSPDFDGFEPIWKVTKSTKNLPYNTVEEYLEQEVSDAKQMYDVMSNSNTISKEELLKQIESERMKNNQAKEVLGAAFKEQSESFKKEYKVAYLKELIKEKSQERLRADNPAGNDLANALMGGSSIDKEIKQVENELEVIGMKREEIEKVELSAMLNKESSKSRNEPESVKIQKTISDLKSLQQLLEQKQNNNYEAVFKEPLEGLEKKRKLAEFQEMYIESKIQIYQGRQGLADIVDRRSQNDFANALNKLTIDDEKLNLNIDGSYFVREIKQKEKELIDSGITIEEIEDVKSRVPNITGDDVFYKESLKSRLAESESVKIQKRYADLNSVVESVLQSLEQRNQKLDDCLLLIDGATNEDQYKNMNKYDKLSLANKISAIECVIEQDNSHRREGTYIRMNKK